MAHYGNTLKAMLESLKYRHTAIADAIGISRTTLYEAVYDSENGNIAPEIMEAIAARLGLPNADTLDDIVRRFMATPDDIGPMAATEIRAAKVAAKIWDPVTRGPRPYSSPDADASRAESQSIGHTIPLHGRIIAGRPVDYQRGIYADKYLPSALVPHPEWKPGAYIVVGDSMETRFHAGDILLVGDRLQGVRTGDLLVVGFTNGDSTFKKLRVVDDDHWELVALNADSGETKKYPRSEIEWYVPVLGRWEPIYLRREVPWEATG